MIDIIIRLIIFAILGYSIGRLIFVIKRVEETVDKIDEIILFNAVIKNSKLSEEEIEQLREKIVKGILK